MRRRAEVGGALRAGLMHRVSRSCCHLCMFSASSGDPPPPSNPPSFGKQDLTLALRGVGLARPLQAHPMTLFHNEATMEFFGYLDYYTRITIEARRDNRRGTRASIRNQS